MIPPSLSLYPFQAGGVAQLIAKKRFLIADDPGLGKTIQLIRAVDVLQQQTYILLKVLVLCPKSMVITWEREVAKWQIGSSIYTIINHDKLITKDGKKLLRKWDIVIADESHQYLKNGQTRRARAFAVINDLSDVVWLSTATPASKSAEDYYQTIRILLPGLKITKPQFINRFCNQVKDRFCYSGYRYTGFKNTFELSEIFKRCSIKRKQKDVAPQLPELTITDYFSDVKYKDLMHLTEEQAEDIKQKALAGKDFGTDYNSILRHQALLKIPSVIELLESYPPEVKVVIFAWHREVVKEVCEQVKELTDRTVDYITGEINSAKERQDIIDRFQEKDLNTLVMNMQSGGVGITLTAATKGIYVQFPYSAIHWVQSKARIHRLGSLKPVQIVKVMIPKSIDEEIFGILESRIESIEQVGV